MNSTVSHINTPNGLHTVLFTLKMAFLIKIIKKSSYGFFYLNVYTADWWNFINKVKQKDTKEGRISKLEIAMSIVRLHQEGGILNSWNIVIIPWTALY